MTVVQANASSAQREPSMEEILASIRRIIEDSDTMQRAEATALLPDTGVATSEPATSDVDAFRAELGTGQPVEAFEALEASVADPAPVDPELEQPADEPAVPIAEEMVAETPEASFIEHDDTSEKTHEPVVQEGLVEPSEAAEPTYVEKTESMSQSAPQYAAQSFNGAASTARGGESVPAPSTVSPSLMSPQAGNQVAASFGDLSEAAQARGRRTFDDIAEEMLRPMLREWLDNNLPHLVERLVREEIERIARGGTSPR